MCLKIDAWLCFGPGPGHEDDYCCGSSSAKCSAMPHHHGKTTTPHYPAQDQRNGHYQYGHHGAAHQANGGEHKSPQQHQPLPADEGDRKASNDARRGHHHTTKAAHGYVYPGADELLKHPAGRGAHYYYQERAPAQKEEYYYRYH